MDKDKGIMTMTRIMTVIMIRTQAYGQGQGHNNNGISMQMDKSQSVYMEKGKCNEKDINKVILEARARIRRKGKGNNSL